MNEIFLTIVVVVILFGLQFFVNKAKKPLLHYIKLSAGIALLLLIWIFGGDSSISVRIILSALALTSLYREYLLIKRFQSNN